MQMATSKVENSAQVLSCLMNFVHDRSFESLVISLIGHFYNCKFLLLLLSSTCPLIIKEFYNKMMFHVITDDSFTNIQTLQLN